MSIPRGFAMLTDGMITSVTRHLYVAPGETLDAPVGTIEVTDHADWQASNGDPVSVIGREVTSTEPLVLAPRAQPPAIRVIGVRDFRRRFTFIERIAFETIALTDPGLRVLFDDLNAGPTVDLDHEDVVDGLAYMKSAALASGLWADEDAADARSQQIRA